MSALNEKTWPILVAVAGLFLAVLIWVGFNQSPVLTFGPADASYIKQFADIGSGRPTVAPTIAPGEKFKVCFDALVWYRFAESIAHMWFYDAGGRRYDLPMNSPLGTRPIPLPPELGTVNPKCRTEVMPDLGMPAGPSVLTGVFISTDAFLWRTRVVTLPYPRMSFVMGSP